VEDRLKRKLAAILYADVAGYSRLTGSDEDATHRTLAEYLDLIAATIGSAGGQVVHYAGDAVLAMYPAVIDAVSSAIDIQALLAERNQDVRDDQMVQFRIGINLGDIIEDRGDIYGDGVNVAARLESLADPGGICISRSVYDQVKSKLDLGYEFLGEQRVKNIAEPISVYRVLLAPEAAGVLIDARQAKSHRWQWIALAAIVVATLTGVVAWLQPWVPNIEPVSVGQMALPLPDKPSIAVLPFENISDDREQEFFADGMTEDLITDLSKISGLFVIARNSSFAYKGKAVEVRKVAEELGVRYVLEGSIRRVSDQVRINVQLIDALTGGHLWADRYDGELVHVFAFQDEVLRKVVVALSVKLKPEEHERLGREHAVTPESYDLFLHARSMLPTYLIDKDRLLRARQLFERVVEQAPDFPGGYAGLSRTYSLAVLRGSSPSPLEDAAKALKWAQTAWNIDEQFEMSASAMANALKVTGQPDKAISILREKQMSAPSDADAHAQLGMLLIWEGLAYDSIGHIDMAIRLNPDFDNPYLIYLALAHFALGEYETSISLLERNSDRGGPIDDAGLAIWAAAYSELARLDEAQEVTDRLFDAYPEFHLKKFWLLRLFVTSEDRNRLTETFKRAGLPEDRPYTR
jgi:TolB-like protein/class 3 adenylate cyclase